MSTYLVRNKNKVLNNRKLLRTSKKPQKDIFMANLTKIGEVLPLLNLETNELWLNRYYKFISERNRDSKPSDQLYERHHVLPRCLFSEETTFMDSTENLTYLTLREHFVAHLILTKVFPAQNKLRITTFMMGCKVSKSNSRTHSSLKEKAAEEISIAMVERWKDSNLRETQSKLAKELWENPEFRANIINKNKALWENPEYREYMNEVLNRPDRLEKISKATKELWKNEKHKEFMSTKSLSRWKDEEFREKTLQAMRSEDNVKNLSKKQKENWENEDYRKTQSKAVREACSTEEHSEKLRENSVKFHASERGAEVRKEHSERMLSKWEGEYRTKQMEMRSSSQYKTSLSEANKKVWSDPSYREKQLKKFSSKEFKEKQREGLVNFYKTEEGKQSSIRRAAKIKAIHNSPEGKISIYRGCIKAAYKRIEKFPERKEEILKRIFEFENKIKELETLKEKTA